MSNEQDKPIAYGLTAAMIAELMRERQSAPAPVADDAAQKDTKNADEENTR